MKKRPKEHTGSFYLEAEIIELLDIIAHIEGQSRAIIVERAVRYCLQGEKNDWEKSKKSTYKKHNEAKSAQKVYVAPKHLRALKSGCKKTKNQPKRAVTALSLFGAEGFPRRESFYPCPASRAELLHTAKGAL
ncbi:hypothetical protein [Helicobacter felis]|uniref:hypothetical protein n=1 Tax=Helicobacter felis TaxID=214 RepID=UPI000CED9463|nr:hypothetical protein [Helicobacter felis]